MLSKADFDEIAAITAQIAARAAASGHQRDFLTELQSCVERIPGADVAFASRSIEYLRENFYLEDRPSASDAQIQEVILAAAAEYEDGASVQDHITELVNSALDEVLPELTGEDENEG